MLLAIDTIGQRAGVALWANDSAVYENTWVANRNHTVKLVPAIERAFAEGGISRGDIDSLAVCTGPGSFSAARAGVAVAKTLGFVWGCPVYGGNCFEVSAHRMSRFVGAALVIAPMGRGRWATQRLNCDGTAAITLAEPRVMDGPDDSIFDGPYFAIVSDDPEIASQLNLVGKVYLRKPTWLAAWAAARMAAGAVGSVDELEPYYLQGARITMPSRQTFRSG